MVDLERGKVLPDSLEECARLGAAIGFDPFDLWGLVIEAQMDLVSRTDDGGMINALGEASFAAPDQVSTIKARPLRSLEIEQRAEIAANALFPNHVAAGAPIPVDELLDIAGIGRAVGIASEVEFELHRLRDGDVVNEEGWAASFDEGVIVCSVRDDVYHRAHEGHGRSRFVIAHELAHAALHAPLMAANRGERFFRDAVCTASERLPPGVRVFESPEWQANTYASAFLMPFAAVEAFIRTQAKTGSECGVAELSRHFKVSRQAAEIRMRKVLPRLVGA